jgi:hypothetical protein
MSATAGAEPGRPWRHRAARSSQVWRMRSAGEQHGQPVWRLEQLPGLGRHPVHDAVDHCRLHRDLTTRPSREGQGFLDAHLDLAWTGRPTARATGVGRSVGRLHQSRHIAPRSRKLAVNHLAWVTLATSPVWRWLRTLYWSLAVAVIPPRPQRSCG